MLEPSLCCAPPSNGKQLCYCHPCRVQTPFHLIVPFTSVPVPPLPHEASSYVHPVSPSLRAPPKWVWLWLMPLVGPRYHPAWRVSLDLLVLGGTGRRADPEPFAPCFRSLHSLGVTPSRKAQPPPIQHFLFTNSRSPQIMVPAGNDSNNNNSFPRPPSPVTGHHAYPISQRAKLTRRQEKPLP